MSPLERPSIVHGPSHPPLMNLTLGELTRRQSRKQTNRVAVISHHQNEEITYSQLHKRSDDLASGMTALGVKQGDRVAVMLGNRSEYVYVRNVCPEKFELLSASELIHHPSSFLRVRK